jgi:YgiT-type zinc finger domain-containing protein
MFGKRRRRDYCFWLTLFARCPRPERMISSNEVETVVVNGELIEDYPQDPRGHSCLMLGFGDADRVVHVVCSPKDEYLAIITAYLPDPAQWSEDFRRRLRNMECIHCKGRMKRGTAPFSLDRNGYHVSWDAVPAWVCTQCGEPFFESREVDLIQRALTELDRESAALASADSSVSKP